jgi:hypothetical protein
VQSFSVALQVIDYLQRTFYNVKAAVFAVVQAFINLDGIVGQVFLSIFETLAKIPGASKVIPGLNNEIARLRDSVAQDKGAFEQLTTEINANLDAGQKNSDMIQGFRGQITHLVTQLETTRGKTVELGRAQQAHTDSTNANTAALKNGTTAHAAHAAAVEKTGKAYDEAAAYTRKFLGEQLAWAQANKTVLAPLLSATGESGLDHERILAKIGMPGLAHVEATAHTVAQGFGAKFLAGMKSNLGGLNNIFEAAFTGGGGALGAVKSYATQTLSTVLNMVPVIGPIISQFSGTIIAGFSKIKDAFSSLFGGPDGKEKEGRKAADAFRDSLAGITTEAQRLEIQTAVNNGANEKWATTMITVRDAYLKAGHTAAEAEAVVDRLWKAEKQGGKEVQKVIDEIRRTMAEKIPEAAETAKDATVDAMQTIAAEAAKAVAAAAAVAQQMKATYDQLLALRGFNGGSAGEGTSEGKNQSNILAGLSASQAQDAYLSSIANHGSTAQDWDRVKDQYGFAQGGIVYAARGAIARGTDTVPAMLTPGEMVLNAGQQRRLWNMANGGGGGGDVVAAIRELQRSIEENPPVVSIEGDRIARGMHRAVKRRLPHRGF